MLRGRGSVSYALHAAGLIPLLSIIGLFGPAAQNNLLHCPRTPAWPGKGANVRHQPHCPVSQDQLVDVMVYGVLLWPPGAAREIHGGRLCTEHVGHLG